ncbi:MAG: hypothetical protein ABIC91_07110 [Nanoarchaeota archaeon]|nr:hypothetical protein [Nanoarchaeota archaeon]
MKNKLRILTLIFVLLLTITLLKAATFTSNPIINNGLANVLTTENLICTWNKTADVTQTNVTWLVNGQHFKNQTNVPNGNSTISYQNTTKGKIWTCRVTISNATSSITKSDTIEIKNSPPNTPRVYNASGQEITNTTTLIEDQTYTLIFNATDPDNDALDYRLWPTINNFCEEIDLNVATVSCTPTNEYLGENNTLGQYSIIFWADDNDLNDPFSAGKTTIFTILPVNDAPEYTLTNQSILQNETLNYYITATDEEEDYPLNISIISNPTLSCLNLTNINDTTNKISCYPGTLIFGNYTITVNITDNPVNPAERLSTIKNFTLEIISINNPPNITSYNYTPVNQSENFILEINASDENEDNMTISTSVSCSLVNPWPTTITSTTWLGNNETKTRGLINLTLNNSHIVCRNITITVTDDGSGSASINLLLNITNINDAPEIFNTSTNLNSPLTNTDINNLVAYQNAPFVYRINATDKDSLTYEGENITYTSNTSFINDNLNTNTGLITFTPNASISGQNYTILITVSDDEGLSVNKTMSLEIIANQEPQFDASNYSISCLEYDETYQNQTCEFDFSMHVSDLDSGTGDSVQYYYDDSALFDINLTTGLINFSAQQTNIGLNTINITIYDERGASATVEMLLEINNTNNAPNLNTINLPAPLVEEHPIVYTMNMSDLDLSLTNTYENLTFTNITNNFNNSITFISIEKQSNVRANLILTLTNQTAGNYSVNITVKDYYNLTSTQTINFTVHPKSTAPDIQQIYPYGLPKSAYTVFAWTVNNFTNAQTEINLTENKTYIFNHSTTDDDGVENLKYTWYYDTTKVTNSRLLENNHTFSQTYDFFSSGNHNLTLVVSDQRLENSTFTWIIETSDVNRPPQLLRALDNLTINASIQINHFLFECGINTRGFYDPDDDRNSNGKINCDTENNTLNYTYSGCSGIVAVEIIKEDDQHGVKFVGRELQSCYVNFTATDGHYNITSNNILLNVTEVASARDTPTYTPGSSIRTVTQTITIPIPEEVEKPVPLDILLPELVTILNNNTIEIPVKIRNNWNTSLYGTTISAKTNVSNIKISFGKNYFYELKSKEVVETYMKVSNYRLGENFEILVYANVTEPPFIDTASVLINSLEQASKGQEVETKVTFARDLLSQNPECQELNELLDGAVETLRKGDYDSTLKTVDNVINGCKYLMSKTKQEKDAPRRFQDVVFKFKQEYFKYGLLIIGFLLVTILGVYTLKKTK